jgi:D-3-phosphoglycerate dehydrogenase
MLIDIIKNEMLHNGQKMKQVLLSAPYMTVSVQRFQPVFKHYGVELIVADVKERLDEAALFDYAGVIDGVICGDDQFNKKVLEACAPRLKIISKWGTGIDSIDQDTARSLGIQVRNTPNAFTLPVADSVLGYMLAFARNIPWMDADIKQGKWVKIPSKSLAEQTLGVIGVGNIGKAILLRAHGFGMNLIGTDIVEVDPAFTRGNGVAMISMEDLLTRADYVSLNCDLNPTSRHLMNANRFALMKRDAVLINTSRGAVVDESALIDVLQTLKIRGAALDVYEEEPLSVDNPLLKMNNVLLGSHNSNSSPMAWERVHWNTIRNLLQGLGIVCDDFDQVRKENIEAYGGKV